MRKNVNGLFVEVSDHTKRIIALEITNEQLRKDVDELKEVIHNMLLKHSPEYKKKNAIDGVHDFLRNRFGEREPRPSE